MDAIIRSASVSKVAFELRRPGERGVAAAARGTPATAPATAPQAQGSQAAPALQGAPAAHLAAAGAATAAASAAAVPHTHGVAGAISLPSALAAAQSMPAGAVRAGVPAQPAVQAPMQAPMQATMSAAPSAPAAAPAPTQAGTAAQEAARLQVQAELAKLHADAEQRGYAAGHDKGEADARRQLQAQIERFQGLAAQMAQAKARVLEDAEDGVVELVFEALCRILGEQAATQLGVQAMVNQCAPAARERENVTVRLHPDDYRLLGPAAPHQARFSPDPAIALGGCMVDSSTGSLDARLETQLARLAETLLAVRDARRRSEDGL